MIVMSAPGKAEQAYDAIEQMIVEQELAPGSLVSESQLMERTQLGRTPVREALQRLARARMVEVHPNRGILVPATSVEAQLKLLELRRVLEALAVRMACRRAQPAVRQEMAAMVDLLRDHDLDLRRYVVTVKDTHELIVRASGNEYLADAMAPLQGLSRRFWLTHVVDEVAEVKSGTLLHGAILSAILEGDADAAEEASHALNDYLVEFAYASIRRAAD